ncbi:MAG TPA: GH92 family glycosyl hydrolase [Candidatus Methylacidiphilales bacterium]|jgi:predicted alpha-1,2-mannosidase|nr:GH92 family glycosyl hydrolase [Candidatus Methylacidiphilales bacterium]
MNKTCLLLLLGLVWQMPAWAADIESSKDADLAAYVNILQGTDSTGGLSHGNTLPLVGMPWGMIDWSVENAYGSWFFQPNGKIDGIRGTHEPSPWISDYGQFVLMPQVGDLKWKAKERMSDYDTTTAVFRPDYEKLDIQGHQITSEMTGTERCAVFKFTFHQGESGRLLVNASGGSEIKIDGRTIRGISRANSGGVSENFASYFVVELDRDIDKSSLFVHDTVSNESSANGDNVIANVEFKTMPDDPVIVRVGTSFISWDQAERNLRAETAGNFDAVHAQALKTWNFNLHRIEIDAGEDQKKTFYSCLYRTQMFPHRLYEMDETGTAQHYSPYDGKIHEGVLYGDIGIWDGFRTTFPLLTLFFPSQYEEILQGFVNASSEGGTIPEWPSPGYRDCMIGQHSAAIFADAVAKGETHFDVAKAYDSLRKSAFEPPTHGELVRRGLADYLKLGYIPDGASEYALSATLDYAYDDWCVAQIAKAQGQIEDYHALMARSQNYHNLWDPAVGFMHAKDANGNWIEPFDQFDWGGPYAESGPWQSSWFVPHDPYGLVKLIGSRDKLAAKMDQMMSLPPTYHTHGYGGVIHEMVEMGVAKFGQYAQSNQPSFANLYLFTIAGQPWKTEYWTRRVCAEMYSSSIDGFPGDEDNGSMAAWYILSSIGLYPFCPGNPSYVFTSPMFDKIVLRLPQGKTFVIDAPANNATNVYVQGRTLNGINDTRTWIAHREITQGGQLIVNMGPNPDKRVVSDPDMPPVYH